MKTMPGKFFALTGLLVAYRTSAIIRPMTSDVGARDAGWPAGALAAQERSGANDCGTLLLCPAVHVFSPSTHGVVLLARPVPERHASPSLVPAPAPRAPQQMGTQESGGSAVLPPPRATTVRRG